MKVHVPVLLVFVIMVPVLLPAEDVTKEAASLKGSWLVTGGSADGTPVPAEEVKKRVVVTFGADKLTTTEEGQTDSAEMDYKINTSQNPKTIDITPETARRGVIRGIYRIDGETLKICLSDPGKERPKAFETKPGSGHKLMVFQRTK